MKNCRRFLNAFGRMSIFQPQANFFVRIGDGGLPGRVAPLQIRKIALNIIHSYLSQVLSRFQEFDVQCASAVIERVQPAPGCYFL